MPTYTKIKLQTHKSSRKRNVPRHWGRDIFLRVGPPKRDEFLRDLLVDLAYALVGKVQGGAIVGGLLLRLGNVV